MLTLWKYIGWPVVAVAICLTFASYVVQPILAPFAAVTSALEGTR